MPFEKDIERKLVARVQALGGMCIKQTSPAHMPDRMVIGPGGFVEYVELKAPKGTVRKGQKELHKRLRALGFRVTVARDDDGINKVITRLKRAAAPQTRAEQPEMVEEAPLSYDQLLEGLELKS